MENLKGMSAVSLEALSKKAAALAVDLRESQPSYELALENGVEDCSYDTVRCGTVGKYRGTAEITMTDGSHWKAIGHSPKGTAEYVSKDGYIEFIPI